MKSPDDRLLDQVGEAIAAINDAVDIEISCSLGTLTREQAQRLKDMGAQRYNHNLETSRSFFPNVVTTHTWEERKQTLDYVREVGMEVCCGGIIGMGESLEQRAEFAAQLAEIDPCEVPMNFLDPRPGTPLRIARWFRWARACAPWRRSAWPCRLPPCALPAAASFRLATTARSAACSAASTPLSPATT